MNRAEALKTLSITLAIAAMATAMPGAAAKEWTVRERQDKLMQEINEAQKRNDLTTAEARKLRSRLADVCRLKKRKKEKNSGNINEDARVALEKELNGISVDIQKLSLEKRVKKPN